MPIDKKLATWQHDGMKLETYLSDVGIKPTAFAAAIGVAPSTITRILRGERSPSLDLVMRIHAATEGKVRAEDWYAPKRRAA